MINRIRFWGIPAASFVLSILLAIVTGPISHVMGVRAAQEPTGVVEVSIMGVCPTTVPSQVQSPILVTGMGFSGASVLVDGQPTSAILGDDNQLFLSLSLSAGSHQIEIMGQGGATDSVTLLASAPDAIDNDSIVGCGQEFLTSLSTLGEIADPQPLTLLETRAGLIDTMLASGNMSSPITLVQSLLNLINAQVGNGLSVEASGILASLYSNVFLNVLQQAQQDRKTLLNKKLENTRLGDIDITIFTQEGVEGEKVSITFSDGRISRTVTTTVTITTLDGKDLEIACKKVEGVPVHLQQDIGAARLPTRYFGLFVMFCVDMKNCLAAGWVQVIKCKDTTTIGGDTNTDRDDADFVLDGGAMRRNPRSKPEFTNRADVVKRCFIDIPGVAANALEGTPATQTTTKCTARTFLFCGAPKTLCGYFEWSFDLKVSEVDGAAVIAQPDDFKAPPKKKVQRGDADFAGARTQLNSLIDEQFRFE